MLWRIAQNRKWNCIIETETDILEIILCLVVSFRASNHTGLFPPLITNFRICFFQFKSQSASNLSAETMLETTLFPVQLKLHGIKPVSFPGSIDVEMLGGSVRVSGFQGLRSSCCLGHAHLTFLFLGCYGPEMGFTSFLWIKVYSLSQF